MNEPGCQSKNFRRLDKFFTVDEVGFAEKGDLLLLGARTLEGMNLTVDPRRKQLVAAGRGFLADILCICRNRAGTLHNPNEPNPKSFLGQINTDLHGFFTCENL